MHKENYPGARQSGSSGKPGALTFVSHSCDTQGSEKSLPLSPGSWPRGPHRSRPWSQCRRSWSWGWIRVWGNPFQPFQELLGTSWSCVCCWDEAAALRPRCHPENMQVCFLPITQFSITSCLCAVGLIYLTLCNSINLGQQMPEFLWWKYPHLDLKSGYDSKI